GDSSFPDQSLWGTRIFYIDYREDATADGATIIEGLELTRGYANTGVDYASYDVNGVDATYKTDHREIAGNGGAIGSLEPLILRDMEIRCNTSSEHGGGFGGSNVVDSQFTLIERSVFENNFAYGYGGAINQYGGRLQIHDSTFVGNEAEGGHGGGIN